MTEDRLKSLESVSIGDSIKVIGINPLDMPSDHYSKFIGRIGTVRDIRSRTSVGLIFNDVKEDEYEIFYPSTDILTLVNREPDWII